MSATFPTSSIVSSSHSNEFIRLCCLKSKGNASFNSNFRFVGCKVPFTENIQATMLKFASLKGVKPAYQSLFEDNIIISDWEDQEGDTEEMGSPWEGAVTYKRNSSVSHVEYCTTLERLGFEKLSTDVSKSRASKMGLRVTKAVKDYPFGTPVQISIDVTRKEKKLRLDGIVKTVITLDCYRYFTYKLAPYIRHFYFNQLKHNICNHFSFHVCAKAKTVCYDAHLPIFKVLSVLLLDCLRFGLINFDY